jgi:hypothetical protein
MGAPMPFMPQLLSSFRTITVCSARTTARCASSTLKALCAIGRAPATAAAPARASSSRSAPGRAAGFRLGARHGLWATPPSAMRTSRILPPAGRRPPPPTPARTHSWRGRAPSHNANAREGQGGNSTAVISSPGGSRCRPPARSSGRRWKSPAAPAFAVRALQMDHGVQRRQRHRHVRRVGRDAVLAGAEDGVDAVMAIDGVAALPGSRLLQWAKAGR